MLCWDPSIFKRLIFGPFQSRRNCSLWNFGARWKSSTCWYWCSHYNLDIIQANVQWSKNFWKACSGQHIERLEVVQQNSVLTSPIPLQKEITAASPSQVSAASVEWLFRDTGQIEGRERQSFLNLSLHVTETFHLFVQAHLIDALDVQNGLPPTQVVKYWRIWNDLSFGYARCLKITPDLLSN